MDPYTTLGVSRSDSDDVIRNKYRELAKKYHPDSYADNPLADLAAEKMKEINAAYDAIMREREGGGKSSGGYNSGTRPGAGAGVNPAYAAVREAIAKSDYASAERLLAGMDNRDAEWHFLYGCVCYGKGWFNDAAINFASARRMDPSNPEYAAAVNNMNYQRTTYHQTGQQTTGQQEAGCGFLECCTAWMCLDCCCRMGF